MITETAISLTDAVIRAPNITEKFDERDLAAIGQSVIEGYNIDEESRSAWKRRMQVALNLALQLQEAKTFPWAGAANVKFPLVTIAAIQWHSRAYPTLLQGPDIVKVRVPGPDPEGELRARGQRVSSYMSYQLLEDSPSWEEETDRAFLQIPIIGCAFKKTYYAGSQGRNVSELVPAQDLVLNYWSRSVEASPRKTHIIRLQRNDIYERCGLKAWRDIRDEAWFQQNALASSNIPSNAQADKRTGQHKPGTSDRTTPYEFLEQYVRMDLDHDGYEEPYVITVEASSGCVCRIMCNFEKEDVLYANDNRREIVRITEGQLFTKYSFIPSPDGGVYDMGFGILLGPVNQAVDSLINQLLDAGTLATTAGGFLGRGVKIRGGEYSFRPFGWQRVDSSGEDLAKGIYPFPVREPSQVLFSLLGLLVDYTNRVSGATDIMVGENPGQNTPAATSQLMAEQGAKINSAIFKRVWRGLKGEFQKLYLLNRKHTPVTILRYGEKSGWVRRDDFQGTEEAIRPAADPNLASDGARVQQAMLIKQQAMTSPGYDMDAVELNLLRAMKVEDIETLYKGAASTPPPKDPRIAVEELKQAGKAQIQDKALQVKIAERLVEMKTDRDKIAAEIELMNAQVAQIVATIGVQKAAHELEIFRARIDALKQIDESYQKYMELQSQASQTPQGSEDGTGTIRTGGGLPGMEAPPSHPGSLAGAGNPDPGGVPPMVSGDLPSPDA